MTFSQSLNALLSSYTPGTLPVISVVVVGKLIVYEFDPLNCCTLAAVGIGIEDGVAEVDHDSIIGDCDASMFSVTSCRGSLWALHSFSCPRIGCCGW